MKKNKKLVVILFILFLLVNVFFVSNLYYDKKDINVMKENNFKEFIYYSSNKITLKNLKRYFVSCIFSDTDTSRFMDLWDDFYKIDSVTYDKFNECDGMVPQGLCIVDDKILVTEYCKCGASHDSLIIVLNKTTGEREKTLILKDNKIHVGGITYNSDTDKVCITGKQYKRYSTIYEIDIFDILSLDDGDFLTKYNEVPVPLNETSFLTYNKVDKELYIGYFAIPFKKGHFYMFDNDMLIENYDCLMQGCDFFRTNGYVAISHSYGPMNSVISINKIDDNGIIETESIDKIVAPPFLEEIAIDYETEKLYCLFESGAKPYRNSTEFSIDGIVVLDFKDYIKLYG